MKKIAIVLLLTLFFVSNVDAKRGGGTTTRPHGDLLTGCTVVYGEYNNVQYHKFDIPKGEDKEICLSITGQTDEVGLIIDRYAVTASDEIIVNAIRPPYSYVGSRPARKYINLPSAMVRRQAFNISSELGVSFSARVGLSLTVKKADHDRSMVIFYDTTESGTLILATGLNTTDDVNKEITIDTPKSKTTSSSVKKN